MINGAGEHLVNLPLVDKNYFIDRFGGHVILYLTNLEVTFSGGGVASARRRPCGGGPAGRVKDGEQLALMIPGQFRRTYVQRHGRFECIAVYRATTLIAPYV